MKRIENKKYLVQLGDRRMLRVPSGLKSLILNTYAETYT